MQENRDLSGQQESKEVLADSHDLGHLEGPKEAKSSFVYNPKVFEVEQESDEGLSSETIDTYALANAIISDLSADPRELAIKLLALVSKSDLSESNLYLSRTLRLVALSRLLELDELPTGADLSLAEALGHFKEGKVDCFYQDECLKLVSQVVSRFGLASTELVNAFLEIPGLSVILWQDVSGEKELGSHICDAIGQMGRVATPAIATFTQMALEKVDPRAAYLGLLTVDRIVSDNKQPSVAGCTEWMIPHYPTESSPPSRSDLYQRKLVSCQLAKLCAYENTVLDFIVQLVDLSQRDPRCIQSSVRREWFLVGADLHSNAAAFAIVAEHEEHSSLLIRSVNDSFATYFSNRANFGPSSSLSRQLECANDLMAHLPIGPHGISNLSNYIVERFTHEPDQSTYFEAALFANLVEKNADLLPLLERSLNKDIPCSPALLWSTADKIFAPDRILSALNSKDVSMIEAGMIAASTYNKIWGENLPLPIVRALAEIERDKLPDFVQQHFKAFTSTL